MRRWCRVNEWLFKLLCNFLQQKYLAVPLTGARPYLFTTQSGRRRVRFTLLRADRETAQRMVEKLRKTTS